MATRIKQEYSITDKNNLVNYKISQTKDVNVQMEWKTVMSSVTPMVIDLTSITNLYTCSVAATAPFTVDLYNSVDSYLSFYGSMLIFSPATTVMSSIENMRITASMDDLEVKISAFGE